MLQFQPQEHLMHSYIVASQSEQARDRLSLDLAAAMLCRASVPDVPGLPQGL